jgi:threonine synthase
MKESGRMKLICTVCEKRYAIDRAELACSCGGLLEVEYDRSGYDAERLKRLFRERLSERMSPAASGVWRYKELIHPDLDEAHIVTKYEGNTGLYASEAVRKHAGIRQLWLKAQSENPSGSFKDNGMTVAVSHGRSLGYRKFACTSTGNTSSSLAMYAALAAADAAILVPSKDISMNKVLQTIGYGGSVFPIEGTYDDGIRFLREHAEELGLYVCNSINPLRIEGQKSILFEAAQQLDWSLPDWIVLPGGALSNASALGKGLRELLELGFIAELPRIAIVQAEGASPFHRMIEKKEAELVPEPNPRTCASALNIGHPPSWRKARRALELTGGVTVSVSDREIMESKQAIDRSGIGCEPASAAGVAGLRKLIASGTIGKDESAMCILTGHMLKDTEIMRIEDAGWSEGSCSLEELHARLTDDRS